MTVKELMVLLLAEIANGHEDDFVFMRIRDNDFDDGYFDVMAQGFVHDTDSLNLIGW